ncbi:helix-turn-helix domain-containing protein [Streptomyces lavendulae]|uniref:helix-turn-helix domain-containing protein n=1 Tax=Streptomyces lavendulae TaxID=1914 RepID=UPI0033EFCD29
MRSESVRARFGKLVSDAAQRAGYDLAKRGTKAELARQMGMTETAVGRMLRGETLPDPRQFEAIAKTVGLNVGDLLVEAGIVSPESLSTPSQTGAAGVGSRSITLDEAANALGIHTPVGREMFAAAVERLQRTERATEADDGGGAAAHA